MRSMTGYGRAAAENEAVRIDATARSVNHRFLDLVLRLPEECRASEAAVQRLARARLERGRVEIGIDVVAVGDRSAHVEVHDEVVAALVASVRRLEKVEGVETTVRASDLLRLPGVVEVRSGDKPWGDAEEALLLEVVTAALDQMIAAREREGAELRGVVEEKLAALEEIVSTLRRLRPQVQAELDASLRSRLTEIGEGGLDSDRLEQEVALLIDKTNIAEELERLEVHLGHLRQPLGDEGAMGKSLDFLVQEVFRELNTLATKCRSTEMSKLCVDAKVLCEELKEQLRNVE